jgi:DME family drug/metabolite transporter
LVAAVLAYALFGEKFSLLGYAGSSLIIAAVLMVVLSGTRGRKTVPGEA